MGAGKGDCQAEDCNSHIKENFSFLISSISCRRLLETHFYFSLCLRIENVLIRNQSKNISNVSLGTQNLGTQNQEGASSGESVAARGLRSCSKDRIPTEKYKLPLKQKAQRASPKKLWLQKIYGLLYFVNMFTKSLQNPLVSNHSKNGQILLPQWFLNLL